MSWVTPVVEIAFASEPLASAPVWVDVSEYVTGPITTKQGRTVELDQPAVGTLKLTLNNQDRRFDPSNAAGPHYGMLTQRKRIRVSVSGTTLFTGWVSGWPQTYDHVGGHATVTLDAIDALGMLAQIPLEQQPFAQVMQRYKPDLWLRLDDEGDFYIDSSGNDNHGSADRGRGLMAPSADTPPLPVGGSKATAWLDNASGVSAGASKILVPPVYAGYTAKRYQAVCGWTKSKWLDGLNPSGTITAAVRVLDTFNASAGRNILNGHMAYVELTDPAPAQASSDGSNMGDTLPIAVTRFDDAWHFHLFVLDRVAKVSRFYYDGALVGWSNQPNNPTLWDGNGYVATGYEIQGPSIRHFATGIAPDAEMQHVAFFNSDDVELFDGTAAANLWSAARGWIGDTEASRVTHLLDAASWPASLRQPSYAGNAVLTETQLPADALSYLLGMTRLDGSTVVANRDGSIKFRNRNELLAQSRSINVQAAFGDDSSFAYRYADAQPALDDQYVYNSISAKRAGSSRRYVMNDKASVAAYFNRRLKLDDIRAFDDLEVAGFARWLLDTYSTPASRLAYLDVDARLSSAVMAKVIDLWLGDRITVSLTPLGVGAATLYTQWIESVEHIIDTTGLTWTARYTTSPARTETLIILDTSTVGGAHELGN